MSSQISSRAQDPMSKVSTHRRESGSTHSPSNGSSKAPYSPQSALLRETTTLQQLQIPRAGPPRVGQPTSATRSSSSFSTLAEPAPQPPQITEVSVAAVMRLAGRLRDLDAVMGLWDDFERECKAPTIFVDLGRYYLDEIYAAVVEVREALRDVQDLADEGSGTKEPGVTEKRAVQVVERVSRWRSEQKQLLLAEVEGELGTSVDETKVKDSEENKVQLPKQEESEMNKVKKGGKGKEKEVVYLSVKQAQEVSKIFVKEVRKGLRSRKVEQEAQETLDMRRILQESIKQRCSEMEEVKGRN